MMNYPKLRKNSNLTWKRPRLGLNISTNRPPMPSGRVGWLRSISWFTWRLLERLVFDLSIPTFVAWWQKRSISQYTENVRQYLFTNSFLVVLDKLLLVNKIWILLLCVFLSSEWPTHRILLKRLVILFSMCSVLRISNKRGVRNY